METFELFQMDLGPHTAAVREVLKFLFEGKLLWGLSPPMDLKVRIVRTVPADIYYACQGGISQDDLTEDTIKGTMTYDDVRSNEIAPIYPKLASIANFKIIEEFFVEGSFQIIANRLPAQFQRFSEFINEDLALCAYSRMANGIGNNIFERIFAVLKSGGWVVGWDGAYPDNVELLAIYPGLRS